MGPPVLLRVAAYRLGLKSGLHPVQRLTGPIARRAVFSAIATVRAQASAKPAWDDSLWWFGWHRAPLPDGLPDWFANPFADTAQPDASRTGGRIPDFGDGDIKGLWELSRMDWAVGLGHHCGSW